MNEKRELKIKNLVTKDGKVYKKDDMPTEIILSTEIEKNIISSKYCKIGSI